MLITFAPWIIGVLLGIAVVYDWYMFRLPNVLTVGGGAAAILLYGPYYGWATVLGGALLGFGLLKLFQLGYHWRYGRWVMGSGDAKLMLPIGALVSAYAGLAAVYGVIVVAVIVALSVALHKQGSNRIPFGPALFSGMLCVLGVNATFPAFFPSLLPFPG